MQSKSSLVLTSLALSALLYGSSPALAQAPSLGSAQNFAVLGGSTVTNAGASTITGDLGVSPGTAITGFPPGIVTGVVHAGDALALQAQSDLTAVYNALSGSACTSVMTNQDLGGLTLTPGVYCFAASAPLNGALTLDAQGDPNAVFIFQIGSTLLAAIDSSVLVINGAQPENVFWQVGSSATLAAGVSFTGNVIALASITLSVGSSVSGRALARTGAVTMDTSNISVPASSGCGTPASVVQLALGCGLGAPLLACTPPILGQLVTANVSGSQPLKLGILLGSPLGTPTKLFRGCSVFYGPQTRNFGRFVTNVTGNDLFMTVPIDVIHCGTQWTLQALILSRRSASVSNALLCTLGF